MIHHKLPQELGVVGMMLGVVAWVCGTVNHFVAPLPIYGRAVYAVAMERHVTPEELTAWITAVSGGITALSGAAVVLAGAALKIHGMYLDRKKRRRRADDEQQK